MKKSKMFLLLLIYFIFILMNSLSAENKDKNKKKKNRIIAAPLAFYTPETKLAFGGAGSYIFRSSGINKNNRPSTISPLIIYTLNKQFKAQIKTDIFLKNDKYRIISFINIQNFPDKFYGIGNDTLEINKENYTSRSKLLTLAFQKKLKLNLSVGVQYHYLNWTISEKQAGGVLDLSSILGSEQGRISGIGFILSFDSRDNIFSPLSGNIFEISTKTYLPFLGSNFNYTDISFDLRHYLPIFSSHVLAIQMQLKSQWGDIPFLSLNKLGGEFNMRGYFNGRYRDKNLFLLQFEYRLPLFWRIGLVGFTSFGNVANKFKDLNLSTMKISYGFGLRFIFDKKEKINIRLDMGFGENGSSVYVSIYEAF